MLFFDVLTEVLRHNNVLYKINEMKDYKNHT